MRSEQEGMPECLEKMQLWSVILHRSAESTAESLPNTGGVGSRNNVRDTADSEEVSCMIALFERCV